MTPASVGVARGILRNAAALFLVGLFAKGAGLVIAVLVARFLGPGAMGLFALLFSIAILVETFISLGLSDSLVREVARHPERASGMYFAALKLVTLIGLIPALVIAGSAFAFAGPGEARSSLLIIALGAPVSGAFVVAQAVLQGSERVLLITWVAFTSRVISLVLLAVALYFGGGVEMAFASRLVFELIAAVIFSVVLFRGRSETELRYPYRELLGRSAPFAMVRVVRELSVRLASFVLPAMMGLHAAGTFDAANRFRSTLGMMMGVSVTGLMPAFTRSFSDPDAKSEGIVGYSLKFMCLGMSVAATAISLLSDWIIVLLFGREFADAAVPLQLLVWAQVLVAVDTVAQQAMLASGSARPAILHSAAGIPVQLGFIVILTSVMGLRGAALAVLLSSATTLALDLRFLAGHASGVPVRRYVGRPLAIAFAVACAMFLTNDTSLVIRVAVALGTWCVGMVLFRVISRNELQFMVKLVTQRSKKSKSVP